MTNRKPVEALTDMELANELEDYARQEMLWNRTAQLFAEASERIAKLTKEEN